MFPFAYLSPTLLLLAVLSLIPIVTVFYYSMMDNVIMNKNPVFVGIANYVEIVTDDVFQQAISNTLYFTLMSVVFHLILGLVLRPAAEHEAARPADQSAFPGDLRAAVGVHRHDHRHPLAADAQPQRRHQLHAE